MKVIHQIHLRSFQKLILFGFCVITALSAKAQQNNEVSIYGKALFSKLDYEISAGDSQQETGFGFGLRYAYSFSPHWSIGLGAEYQSLQGKAYLPEVQDSYTTTDNEGENFEFRYTLKNYGEKQQLDFLNIPLTLQYETSGNTRFYIAGGAKVGFVLNSTYQPNAQSLKTSGFYEQYNAELKAPKFMGFGDFGNYQAAKKDLELKTNYSATLELGVKQIEEEGSFYIGLFMDYGLNDLRDGGQKKSLIGYQTDTPSSFTKESVLYASNQHQQKAYSGSIKTMAYGIKIAYALGW